MLNVYYDILIYVHTVLNNLLYLSVLMYYNYIITNTNTVALATYILYYRILMVALAYIALLVQCIQC